MLFRILGIAALVAGVVILVYGGFSVPKNKDAKLGPIEVSVKQSDKVPVPTWAGVASIAAGGLMLLWSAKRR
jgi:UDP-N-acetylmuramyl pentapeptide phosphotransferase/UDP-N-acetylglucosamine-1-phosphate transferase